MKALPAETEVHEGGCLCGQARYQVAGAPAPIADGTPAQAWRFDTAVMASAMQRAATTATAAAPAAPSEVAAVAPALGSASRAAQNDLGASSGPHSQRKGTTMELGAFSISLAVKDIAASKAFYEALGFSIFGGNQAQNWLIMKNGQALVGLFQGMFEKNMLTFNPGWDTDAAPLPEFADVRAIQRHLLAQGLALQSQADEASTGPASFVAIDPDGNPVLVDQHR
jgi:catechol 2,3-dioxygenase-like lactoylglutathione lyase family enzyme